jgi:peroxiredoxin Q/BCP
MVTVGLIGFAMLVLSSTVVIAGTGAPAVGDQAPAFELQGSDGKTYRLADFRGKQVVVLAWFPKAFTGG